MKPSEYEQSVIDSLNSSAPQKPEGKKRKRKRPKGPNPLSVKKSQKFVVQDKSVPGGIVSRSKVGI